jgi:hypothetical protein
VREADVGIPDLQADVSRIAIASTSCPKLMAASLGGSC